MNMTDVRIIDQQHQELINKLNRLNDAVKNNESREDVYRFIDEAISYTRFHFATEEQIMAECGYPVTEEHKEKHKQLVQDAIHLKDHLETVGKNMFSDWFIHWPFSRVLAHIKYADRQLEDYINNTEDKP
jgi:hemerythrin